MTTWGIIIIAVAVVLLGTTLFLLRGGREDRAARRDLRRLRNAEKRGPDTHGAAELRRNMYMEQIPGKDTNPGGA